MRVASNLNLKNDMTIIFDGKFISYDVYGTIGNMN